MKTQIITLESHDDLISVRDRLSWAKTPRILLIWPKGEQIALRSLDLKVLQRHADSLGAQLGIVTRLDSVRRKAEALDLPVFESSAAAQRDAWPQPAKPRRRRIPRPPRNLRALRKDAVFAEAPWRSHLAVRVVVFAAGVLAVLVLAAAFLPRASITLYPESRTQQLVIPISAATTTGSVYLTGSLPARVEKVVLSGSKAVNTSTRISVPMMAARGVVRFRNLTSNDVTVPAGTVVFVPGGAPVRFRTLNQTLLKAGPDQIAEVPVEAVQAGASGNVDAGAIQAIEGSLGLSAAVENPEPTGGGSDTTALGAAEDDRLRLFDSLVAGLKTEAGTELQERLPRGDLLLPGTLTVSQTLEETYDPPPGKPGTRLVLNARLEFSAEVVSYSDLTRLAEGALNAALPPGFSPAAGSLDFKPVSVPETDAAGTTHWQMQAGRRILRSINPSQVVAEVRGRSARSARLALDGVSHWERAPQIRLSPSWWPWLPLIPFGISVAFQ